MKTSEIVKQAWQQVVHHRSLWIFGFLVALTTFSWGSMALFGRSSNGDPTETGIQIQRRSYETFGDALERGIKEELDQASEELESLMAQELDLQVSIDIVAIFASLVGIGATFYLIAKVLRYVSEVALIRLIDEHHQTGIRSGIKDGFRLGWSWVCLRLFMITLVINLVAAAAGLLLLALIFSPLPLWVDRGEGVVAAGAIITAALFFIAIFVIILGRMGATLVRILAWRAAALDGTGVVASAYRGFSLLRHNWKRLVPLSLIGLGVNLAFPTLIAVLVIPLIGLGVVLGGVPGLIFGGVANLAGTGDSAVILGITAAVLILFVVVVAPLAFVDGLREVFLSSIWTQAYRELMRLELEEQTAPPNLDID